MIEIPLSSEKYPGLVALVDDEDAELVAGYTWCVDRADRTFYAQAYDPETKKLVRMHRLIRPGIEGEIDHADRDGLNNTWANLRPASRPFQSANRGRQSNNTSGYKGVYEYKGRRKPWWAYIKLNGRRRSLGYYADPADAARAYDAAAREHFGEFAALNFPDERMAA